MMRGIRRKIAQSMEEQDEKRLGRSWTERNTGPIRYRRFVDIDAGGRRALLFKFELAPGQDDLPQVVYDALQDLKHLKHGPGRGGGWQHTNLTFNRSKRHGRVWRLDDTPTGRYVADPLDRKLSELAEKIEREQGPRR